MTLESESKKLTWMGAISLVTAFPFWIVPLVLSILCLVKTHRLQKAMDAASSTDFTAAMVCSVFALVIVIIKIPILILILVLYTMGVNC